MTGAFVSPFASLLDGDYEPGADEDERLLALALREAEQGLGRTHPNPPVGCVVAKDGKVLAKGSHEKAGGPHAEVVALDRAQRGETNGATLYVSLEPCVHHGKTPPCTERILQDGITRVVVGVRDPNPEVAGKGIERLRAAGVEVDLVPAGPLAERCRALIAPFRSTMQRARPWVVAKIASTLDGRVATRTGDARWVTGEDSRALVHGLRDRADAILVGSGTALTDDPRLTARDAANTRAPRNPLRVVVDGALRTSPTLKAYGAQRGDVVSPAALVAHASGAPAARARAFDDAGVARVPCGDGEHVDLERLLTELCARGVTSVMAETGPRLLQALLARDLVDELWWFTAPKLVGEDGVAAAAALGVTEMADAFVLAGARGRSIGPDTLVVGRPGRRRDG